MYKGNTAHNFSLAATGRLQHQPLRTTTNNATNRRSPAMHSHVRRNAYMYTTADLAMTAIDCDNYTLKEVLFAPNDHSGESSGIADCTKETYPLPIQQAALNKLGLGCGGVVAPVRAVESSENQE
jgi:hypothetical protein